MSRGITRSQLQQSGYCEVSPGVWGQKPLQAAPAGSSPPHVERHPVRKPKGTDAGQEGRKSASRYSPLHVEGTRYRLLVHSYRVKLIDPSNAYLKALEDRLTHHGIIPDDSPKFCDQPIFLQTQVMPGDERTAIEVLSYSNEDNSEVKK